MVHWIHICLSICCALAGQATRPAGVGGWMDDYNLALRSELVDGDLQAAIVGYRRVVASRAPNTYSRQARYRWANALRQLGRDDEAATLLESLARELPSGAPLGDYARRHLAQMRESKGNRLHYWQQELRNSVDTADLARFKEAADYLSHVEGSEGVVTLCEAYRELSLDHPCRAMLIGFLGQSEWPEAVELLRPALSDSVPAVVAAAAAALGELGDARSVPRMIELLSAEQLEVRRAAVQGLSRLRPVASVGALIQIVESDADAQLRGAAARVLFDIGTEAGLEAAERAESQGLDLKASERCSLSLWYRKHLTASSLASYLPPSVPAAGVRHSPRIGVVVSAMTHHAANCSGAVRSYAGQIRKAWALQRAGYEVALLAEAEVPHDPQAAGLGQLLGPDVSLHGPGQWPACDAVLLDGIFHLSAPMVRALAEYCHSGGNLVVCGAAGGAYCGDWGTWRQLIQVRRSHSRGFESESAQLIGTDVEHRGPEKRLPTPFSALLLGSPTDWSGPRRGNFFSHEPLGGTVIAEQDYPPIWAIKLNRYGAGCVLVFNWDVGLSLKGTHDEDELLCRAFDALLASKCAGLDTTTQTQQTQLGEQAGGYESALFSLMRHARWGRWTLAKETLTPASLERLSVEQGREAVMQLANIYHLENNLAAGGLVCERLLAAGHDHGGMAHSLERLKAIPRRLQLCLVKGNSWPWWQDVPRWQRLPISGPGEPQPASIPLWLAGPADLPAKIRVRLSVPGNTSGQFTVYIKNCEVVGGPEEQARQQAQFGPHVRRIGYRADEAQDGWYEFRVQITELNAFIGIELDSAGS